MTRSTSSLPGAMGPMTSPLQEVEPDSVSPRFPQVTPTLSVWICITTFPGFREQVSFCIGGGGEQRLLSLRRNYQSPCTLHYCPLLLSQSSQPYSQSIECRSPVSTPLPQSPPITRPSPLEVTSEKVLKADRF